MERGLLIGGVLICGSIALAVMLNVSGSDDAPRAPAAVGVRAEGVAVAPSVPASAVSGVETCRSQDMSGTTPAEAVHVQRSERPGC